VISADKLSALVESLGAVIWEVDASTFQFTFVSGQADAILGYPTATIPILIPIPNQNGRVQSPWRTSRAA
jgi:PAS domain-containing protein